MTLWQLSKCSMCITAIWKEESRFACRGASDEYLERGWSNLDVVWPRDQGQGCSVSPWTYLHREYRPALALLKTPESYESRYTISCQNNNPSLTLWSFLPIPCKQLILMVDKCQQINIPATQVGKTTRRDSNLLEITGYCSQRADAVIVLFFFI